MTKRYTLSLLTILLILLPNANAFKFLVISPVFGFSHMKSMAAIANQLADAGHEVTYFQPFVMERFQNHDLLKNPHIEVINYWLDEEGHKNMAQDSALSDAWNSSKYQSDVGVRIIVPTVLHASFEHMCRKMFQDKELHAMLKARDYDVVLSETFDFCGLYLADYLEVRSIISVFTGCKLNAITNALGEPSFLHYFPSPTSNIGPDLTIYDRFNNLWHKVLSSGAFAALFDLQYEAVNRIANGKVRHWTKILNDVTYHFTNSNPYLDFVVPTIPKVIPIGGYTMDYTQIPSVPKELDELLNKRPYTVFVSYGSMVAAKFMPEEYKWGMIKLFAANPNVTFLWKYEEPEDEFIRNNMPENGHIGKWFPQQSLLADKRVKLFITHGGLGSTMELAYAAKPAIVTPLFADQPSNAQMLSRHGSIEVYSKYDIPDWKKQSALLRKMLADESYQVAATRLADILTHQPISPRELMVKHAENAARFGKMPTLTPFAKDMGVVEFYNLDIIVISISLVLFAIYGVLEVYGFVRRCCGRRKVKVQ